MATYAIGDIQGCYAEFQDLLALIQFDQNTDTLWLTGDLINRGPDSLAVLEFIQSIQSSVIITLGNHDLHFLAVAMQAVPYRKHKDTFADILQTKDLNKHCDFLLQQKLCHVKNDFIMSHAGIPPQWDVATAQRLAREVETVLQSGQAAELFQHMYSDQPDIWNENLQSWERYRIIINYFTRMRFCDSDGRLALNCKSTLGSQPKGYHPWFSFDDRKAKDNKIIFGHWAALNGKVDTANVFALDTGCVWGGSLTAFRLEDQSYFSVSAKT